MEDIRPPTGPSWPWAGVMRTRLCMGVFILWEGDTCIRWLLLNVPGGGAAKAKEQIANNAAVAARVFFMASSFRTVYVQIVVFVKRDFWPVKEFFL